MWYDETSNQTVCKGVLIYVLLVPSFLLKVSHKFFESLVCLVTFSHSDCGLLLRRVHSFTSSSPSPTKSLVLNYTVTSGTERDIVLRISSYHHEGRVEGEQNPCCQ